MVSNAREVLINTAREAIAGDVEIGLPVGTVVYRPDVEGVLDAFLTHPDALVDVLIEAGALQPYEDKTGLMLYTRRVVQTDTTP